MSKPLYRLNQKEPHIGTLIVMSSFASMGAIILTPALPKIASYFNISEGHSQLTVTLFLIGYTLGQLLYGPLANRFGRKKSFFIGITIATCGSLLSIAAEPLHSFLLLMVGRCIEALGASAGLVIAYTVINDYYYPEQARKIVAYMSLAFAIIPGIATLIGGSLISHFSSWLACFYFLLIYGLSLIVPASCLTETAHTLDVTALDQSHIQATYKTAFHNKTLVYFSSFLGLSMTGVYLYAAAAPIIAINRLGYSEQFFALIGLIPYIGTALGSLTAASLAKKFSAKTLLTFAFGLEILGALTLAICFFSKHVSLLVLLGAIFFYMFGSCLITSNCASLAPSTLADKANASAIMNFFTLMLPVCGTFLLAIIPVGSVVTKFPALLIGELMLMALLWPKLWRTI